MRRHFKLAVVFNFLSSFLQAAFLPMGYMVSFQQAFTDRQLHFPSCWGMLRRANSIAFQKGDLAEWAAAKRCTETMRLLRKWTLNVTGTLEIAFVMTYWFAPFSNIHLSHPEENPQALIHERTIFLLRVTSGALFTSMSFCLKINMHCHPLNYHQL